jgi:hypothetical protein
MWEFAKYEKQVSGVLLATDGMLEPFFPVYIRNEPVSIYVRLAGFFMDNRSLRIDRAGEAEIQSQMEEYISNIPEEQINDDKTLVALLDSSLTPEVQPEAYYAEPDWAALKQKSDDEWKRLAYPHMYGG